MIDKIAEWLDWLGITVSATTLAGYGWHLRALEKWSDGRDVLSLTRSDLAHYLADRRALRHWEDATIKHAVNAFKSFYRYALGSRSPAKSITAPSAKRKKQRTLDWQQALAVMASCDTSSARGRRDLALVCLLLDSGLRESEVCRLMIENVDLERRRLIVQIKGGDDGEGVFGPDTVAMLSAWLAIRPVFALPGVANFFVSVGGTLPGQAITPSGLRCIFRRIGKSAGLEHFSPHDLRRSFATLSHQIGAPTRIVQVAGRWSDLKMVERYTAALSAEDFAPYSPVSRILNLNRDV